ncbi:leucine zipper putative tumor suppressor 2 homolog [Danio aesculapii]|uniref:leucine zipper putative tumor suppressor 2 homolog n=1 Tax=Danio aesculapii TaxID=1142201 RepID=UPI0024BFEC19|nr:leucine zipper putative tumor suppressor 2 homolog [Danio aesculapii]XP_056319241.1 leucine zipper putative tumor suppressor 2 homolog [Danio aesculapii]XP_056319242.1 leucine zipper putative tumor suppressor 2 homolog [Danio aesculapii]
MGSVSSLISGHSLHSKHCKASENKLKKGLQSKKTGRSLDGLLKYGFTQDHCSTNNNSKVSYHSGKNDDFYYIKVSNKPRGVQHNINTTEDSQGRAAEMDNEVDRRGGPPELVPLSGKLEKSIEPALIRPTAFKPVLPRSSSSSVETHNNLSTILGRRISPIDRLKDLQDPKLETNSGTFSDSGRNSMSSLPTHSTSGSSQMDNLSTSTNHMARHGGLAQNTDTSQNPQGGIAGMNGNSGFSWMNSGTNGNMWANGFSETNRNCESTNGNTRSIGVLSESVAAAISLNREITAAALTVLSTEPKTDFTGNQEQLLEHRFTFLEQSSKKPSPSGGCVRSPISMDESLIQQLEQKLLERESELAELQTSLEEKETDTCQLFEEKQRYCAEEMEGLKQRCSTKLRQVSQRAVKAQQLLQLQVIQLQQDKDRLQEEVDQLNRDRDTAESRIRIYESQKNLVPTLEETQWEVCQKSGEISLLKQQLRDSQTDAGNKLSEIVTLKATLKESRCKMEELEQKIKECEETLHERSAEVEVSKNEFQRKKNEADLLREKVNKLETDIKGMKQDLAMAKEEQQQLMAMRAKVEEQQLQLQISQARMEAFGSGHAKSNAHEGTGACKTLNHNGTTTNLDTLQKEVERLRGELKEEKQKKLKMMNSFQQERQTWNKEKDKVIRYQKQLQYNYLQMYRKNRDLEKILRELTAEMDKRTELDMDSHSADLNFDKIVATEI